MLPAFATSDDLDARLPGGIPSGSEARALTALDDASAIIRSVAGKTWTTDGELDDDVPDVVATVCLSSARRSMVNPDGLETEEIDGYRAGYGNDSPDVYLTKSERQMIRGAAGVSGIGVLRVTRGDLETPAVVECWPGPG